MTNMQLILKRLGVTQKALAEGLECSQANVSFYMQGQTIPPDKALRLIEFARQKGVLVTLDEIYLPISADASVSQSAAL